MKRFFLFLTMICTVYAINLAYAPDLPDDSLSVWSQQTYPATVESSDTDVILSVTFLHNGMHSYKDINIEAKFQSPFTPVKSTYYIAKMNPGDRYTSVFRFNVSSADPGAYSVPLVITYTDLTSDAKVTGQRTLVVPVSSTPRLEITGIRTTPEKIAVGGRFSAEIDLKNTGDMPASDVYVTLSFTNNSYINLITPNPQKISTIDARSTGKIVFEGIVTPYSPSGGVISQVSINYNQLTATESFIFPIEGQAALDIREFASDVSPGREGKVGFKIYNIGESRFSDVIVTVSSNSSYVAFTDSSQFVGDILPGFSESAEFPVFIDRSASAGVYPMSITIQSPQGSRQQTASVVVKGVPNLAIAGVSTDTDPMPGKKISLSVQLENSGTGKARTIKAALDGELTGSKVAFVGKIDPDDSDSAIFDITFKDTGTNILDLNVTYVDDGGEWHTLNTPVAVFVYSAPVDFAPAVLVIVLAAIVIFFYLWKKERRHKLSHIR
jgi:hypothetical protein